MNKIHGALVLFCVLCVFFYSYFFIFVASIYVFLHRNKEIYRKSVRANLILPLLFYYVPSSYINDIKQCKKILSFSFFIFLKNSPVLQKLYAPMLQANDYKKLFVKNAPNKYSSKITSDIFWMRQI